jgi:hypothetical protein
MHWYQRMDRHISRNVADTLRSWYAYPWNRNRENIYRTVINLTLTEHKTTWTNQRKTASKNQLPSLFASFFLTPFSLPLLPCKPNQWEPVNHGHRQTSYPTKAKLPKWGRESPTQGFLFPVYTTSLKIITLIGIHMYIHEKAMWGMQSTYFRQRNKFSSYIYFLHVN